MDLCKELLLMWEMSISIFRVLSCLVLSPCSGRTRGRLGTVEATCSTIIAGMEREKSVTQPLHTLHNQRARARDSEGEKWQISHPVVSPKGEICAVLRWRHRCCLLPLGPVLRTHRPHSSISTSTLRKSSCSRELGTVTCSTWG